MIFNATLIRYTTAPAADGRGGKTPGTSTAYSAGTRCTVDEPTRSQTTAAADVRVRLAATVYVLLPVAPRPQLGGSVTYRVDGDTDDRTLTVFKATPASHGRQSHVELLLEDA